MSRLDKAVGFGGVTISPIIVVGVWRFVHRNGRAPKPNASHQPHFTSALISSDMTVATGTRDWFVKKFGILDDEALAKIVSLQSVFQLSNEDVYIKWESFVVTHENGDLDVSVENVSKFQLYLQDSLAQSLKKKTPAAKKVRDLAGSKRIASNFSSSPSMRVSSTPSLKRRKPDTVPSSEPDSSPLKKHALLSSPRKGAASADSNTVLECLNPNVDVSEFAESVELAANFDPQKYKFRTMAMKLLESADVLDEQIDTFAEKFLEQLKSSDLQLGNPCMSSQFDIVCCGRIVPDSPFYDSMIFQNLNDKSLFLETSRLGGIGQRIPLDLSNLKEYSFFPGQIVGLKGRNPTGRTFVAHEVMSLPMLGPSASPLSELENHGQDGKGVKVFIAAGPYSNQNSLNYSKFEELVAHINDNVKPQVAILLGPFLDITNKAVELGDIELPNLAVNQQPKNLEELFKLSVVPLLKKIDSQIQVILIPSLKDSINTHTSYPQAGFDRKKLGLPKNFKCFPNPSTFSVNEAMFGVSNADIFKDLKDIYKSDVGPDSSKLFSNRFERIVDHVFQQRRFYPMFPGSVKRAPLSKEELDSLIILHDGVMAEDLAETEVGGSSLELPYLGLTELGDALPDVFIAPSELRYLAKVVNGVVVINPGQLIRPSKDATKEDGSYVVLNIRAPNASEDDNIEQVGNSELYYHNIDKRSRVEIYKS